MIKPTIGRVVWYYPVGKDNQQPNAALVTYVHSDTCINIAGFHSNGHPYSVQFVVLKQSDTDDVPVAHAEWMPFQQGQAAKTEELEKKLNQPPAVKA